MIGFFWLFQLNLTEIAEFEAEKQIFGYTKDN